MANSKFFEGFGWGIPQYFENGEWWYWIPGTGTIPESKLIDYDNNRDEKIF